MYEFFDYYIFNSSSSHQDSKVPQMPSVSIREELLLTLMGHFALSLYNAIVLFHPNAREEPYPASAVATIIHLTFLPSPF